MPVMQVICHLDTSTKLSLCRRYGFLYEKAIPTEVSELKAAMRKSTDASEQRRMQVKLSRLQQSLKQHEDRSLELEV